MRSIEHQHEVSWPKAMVLSVLYVLLYVLLDRASFIHALQHTEVSPWGPNIALMIAVVMRYGARVAPLTILAPGISEIVLRDAAPLGWAAIGAVVCIGCTYTASGMLLRRLHRNYSQPTIEWFAVLLAVIISSALLNAMLYSAVLIQNGNLSAGSYLTAVRIEWVGDVNGIIILLPLVLILRAGEAGKFGRNSRPNRLDRPADGGARIRFLDYFSQRVGNFRSRESNSVLFAVSADHLDCLAMGCGRHGCRARGFADRHRRLRREAQHAGVLSGDPGAHDCARGHGVVLGHLGFGKRANQPAHALEGR